MCAAFKRAGNSTVYECKPKEMRQTYATTLTGKLQATTYSKKHKFVDQLKDEVKQLARCCLERRNECRKRNISHTEIKKRS